MMHPLHKLHEHHSKAIRVILSCETLEQLDVARKYCLVLMNFHVKTMSGVHRNYKKSYINGINESESFMNKALNEHRSRIIRVMRSKN